MKSCWEIVDTLMDYGLHAAGADDVPEQQEWAADCLEAASYIMTGFNITEWESKYGPRFVWSQKDIDEKAEQFRMRAKKLTEEKQNVSHQVQN